MTAPDEVVRIALAAALGGAGVLILIAAALGALRFADVYERAHAVRAAALGAPLVLGAFAVLAWDWGEALRLALVAAVLAAGGPALAHLVAHAAHRDGIEPAARAARKAPPP